MYKVSVDVLIECKGLLELLSTKCENSILLSKKGSLIDKKNKQYLKRSKKLAKFLEDEYYIQ